MLTQRRGINIYKISGHATTANLIPINSILESYKGKPILIDMTDCKSIDNTILLLFVKTIQLQSKKLIKFQSIDESIMSKIRNKGLDPYFECYSNFNDALNSYTI